MNVLSLFNGVSCGRLALERAGISIDKYYSSEIDKYALAVDAKNYPDNIQLGDVTKWREWDIDLTKIDLIMAGSPCQGFSLAGKQLAFDDPRSKLFFEFVDILKKVKPKYFLLENVKMKKEYQDIISDILGVKPIQINSSLVSAQSRKRLYWTNIPNVKQPEDKKIYLKDVLEQEVEAKYFLSEKLVNGFLNSKSVFRDRFKPIEDGNTKSQCLTARYFKMGKTDPYIMEKPMRLGSFNKGGQGDRVYNKDAKSVTLSAHGGGRGAKTGLYYVENGIRKLTPIECERLQNLPDNWTEGVSNTRRYQCCGNGWTVDVIAHIIRNIKE